MTAPELHRSNNSCLLTLLYYPIHSDTVSNHELQLDSDLQDRQEPKPELSSTCRLKTAFVCPQSMYGLPEQAKTDSNARAATSK